MLSNKDLTNKMEQNSRENVEAVFDSYFDSEMSGLLHNSMDLYKRVVDNDKLKN